MNEKIIDILLASILNRQKNIFAKQLRAINCKVTPDQLNILTSLYEQDGQYQKQIGEGILKDKPNITRMLDILESHGYLKRLTDSNDRRKFAIFITSKGKKTVEKVLPLVKKNKKSIKQFLSSKDEQNLRFILQKIEKALSELEKTLLVIIIIFHVFLIPLPTAAKENTQTSEVKSKAYTQAEEILLEKPSILERQGNGDLKILEELDVLGPTDITGKEGEQTNLTKQAQIEDNIEEIEKELQGYLEVTLTPATLNDCLTIALDNNFDIKIITEERERTRWNFYKNITEFIPNFDYAYSLNRLSGEFLLGNFIPVNLQETPIRSIWYMDWDLIRGLSRVFNTQAAKRRYDANDERLQFQKDQTILDVSVAYYTLLQQKLNNQILTRNLKEREAQLTINQQRFDAGVGTKFDVLRAEAEVARAKQLLLRSYNSVRLAQASLANTMGINVFTPIYPIENEISKKTLMDKNLKVNIISNIAMETRNDLKAERLLMRAARSDRKAAYSTYIPTINMTGSIQDAGTNDIKLRRGYELGVFAYWSGGRGFGTYGITDIREKDAIFQTQKYKTINLARRIQENVITSFYDSRTAEENIIAAKQELESANESLRLAFLRLEAGIGIFVDVLQAQAAATQAKINLINVTIDYNIAQARLLFDSGLISVNNILEGYNVSQEQKEKDTSKASIYKPGDQPKQGEQPLQTQTENQNKSQPTNAQDPRYPKARPQGMPNNRAVRPSIAQPNVEQP